MSAKDTSQMNAIEIARRMAELGETERALQAYEIALKQEETAAEDRFEAACALLQFGDDYTVAYDGFLALHRETDFREDAFGILTEAFYLPNEKAIQEQYEKNCRLLKKYPYLFRKDFLPFEELPVKFYPYDNKGVIPFHTKEERFGLYTDLNDPEVTHYFFRDLEKPILATDIFSQYELEYLRDNVRRSEWVGKENHVYLHYTNWGEFCSYLQVWDMKPLLAENKFVFLIGEEVSRYPIDFKEEFGVDYSNYPVKPLSIREINKIVWHTQLLYHNGGDFFNEILHGHPYLLADDSDMFVDTLEAFQRLLNSANRIAKSKGNEIWGDDTLKTFDQPVLQQLVDLKHRTLKDAMVAYYLGQKKYTRHLTPGSRVVPAVVYQPHFRNMSFRWNLHEQGGIIAHCSAYEDIKNCGALQGFKYIKTFTPMRRPTNSHAATIAFIKKQANQGQLIDKITKKNELLIAEDIYFERIMNRSYMTDDEDRLLRDSRLVRFEDAKLAPKATFTALAQFLDIPYAESMEFCSNESGILENGFRMNAVYNTRDEYSDEYERRLMEYLLRDVYKYYGYDFHYYDETPLTQGEIEELLNKCHVNEEIVRFSWQKAKEKIAKQFDVSGDALEAFIKEAEEKNVNTHKEKRLLAIRVLGHGLHFCNEKGTPLRLMTMLQPKPELMKQPLYR